MLTVASTFLLLIFAFFMDMQTVEATNGS